MNFSHISLSEKSRLDRSPLVHSAASTLTGPGVVHVPRAAMKARAIDVNVPLLAHKCPSVS
jgi:hypothetical protein